MGKLQKLICFTLFIVFVFSSVPVAFANEDFFADIYIKDYKVTIKGRALSNSLIIIIVYRCDDGGITYIDQIKADEKGDYIVKFKIDKGKYEAVLNNNGNKIKETFTVGETDKKGFVTVKAEGVDRTAF